MQTHDAGTRQSLACAQSASLCKTWQGEGDATAGTVQSCAEFQFYLDVDTQTGTEMVHISEAKQASARAI